MTEKRKNLDELLDRLATSTREFVGRKVGALAERMSGTEARIAQLERRVAELEAAQPKSKARR